MRIKSIISLLLLSALFLVSCAGNTIIIGATPCGSETPGETTSGQQTTAAPTVTELPVTTTHQTPTNTNVPDTTVTATPDITPTPSETPGNEPLPWNPEFGKNIMLTTDGLYEVAKSDNIIVFIIDRLDISYYNILRMTSPSFTNKLTDFTAFTDNISLYSRTYPAITTMLTGIDNDYTGTMSEYYSKAYYNSTLLRDLRANGYTLKLYLQDYYSYSKNTPFYGVVENAALETSDKTMFESNDVSIINGFRENGLSLSDDNKSFIFYHLNGCHTPVQIDRDGNALEKGGREDSEIIEALRGCFSFIYDYIEELKALGVYDNSTIIITGDHPAPISDTILPDTPRVTPVFVKTPNASGAIKYSSAQVSQENFIPTIIKCGGIKSENEYGQSYFEIEEGKNYTRYHQFQRTNYSVGSYVALYEITGKGTNFENWKLVKETFIGKFYRDD